MTRKLSEENNMFNDNSRNDDYAGEHVEGMTREREEESRKAKFFKGFKQDSNGSPTRLHEDMNGRDRNK